MVVIKAYLNAVRTDTTEQEKLMLQERDTEKKTESRIQTEGLALGATRCPVLQSEGTSVSA